MTDSYKKPLAAVTGASSGIGYELAKQFVDHGYDLIVNSASARIYKAANALSAGGAQVQPLQADLTLYDGVEKLYEAVKSDGRPLDSIVLNAGVGVHGPFKDTSLQDELNMIALNVTSVVHLAKLVVADMAAQGAGRILITSSIAGIMPAPYETVYGATKAFLLSFAEGLRNELKDSGVTVTALMPGATETDFFRRAGMEETKIGKSKKDDPADVARDGYEALMRGEDKVIAHSVKTKLQGGIARLLPDTVTAAMHREQSEPSVTAR